MRGAAGKQFIIDILFVLTLFMLFAASSIMLIALGADIYQGNVNRVEENYELRTSYAYLAEKVRQSDRDASIEAGTFDGLNAVLLHEEINDIPYTTYLYVYEGYLCELFTRSELSFEAWSGTKIMALKALTAEMVTDSLIRVKLSEQGGAERVLFAAVKSGKEAPDEDQ